MTGCPWRAQRNLLRFAWNGHRAVRAFERRMKRGEPFFPAFLMLSITNQCNLKCRGCWVSQTDPPCRLTLEQMQGIVDTAAKYKSRFFGILGGEPLFHPELMTLFRNNSGAYFQLYTNGTMLDKRTADELAELGNVTALVSIEGLETGLFTYFAHPDLFRFTGSGWGHNCGMSQWGAYAMAKYYEKDHRFILGYYYTQVGISYGTLA